MSRRKEPRRPPGFMEIYKRIRKDMPGSTRVEEPGKGKGHSYSKRDRRAWRKGG